MDFLEILKVIFLGIVEGVTEWLPISSTGHMLLVDEFLKINMDQDFKNLFLIWIQLGAILAVILLFWKKMWPFQLKDKNKPFMIKETFSIWFKVVVACIPGAIVTIGCGDFVDAHFETPQVIAAALIVYGVAFIVIERWNKKKTPKIVSLEDITYKTAFFIGLFQVLSIIPGTSRSGATIIGALLLGVSRVAAAEFTFFLAVPVMLGMSALELLDFGFAFTGTELAILVLGMATAFVVSVLVIKFLMSYIKKKDFTLFGWYRIVLGAVILVWAFIGM